MKYRRLTAENLAYIKTHWGKVPAREIADHLDCRPHAVRYHANKSGLGPGVASTGKPRGDGIPKTSKPWPDGALFEDIVDPECDRFPLCGHVPIPLPEVSPGNGTAMCVEVGR